MQTSFFRNSFFRIALVAFAQTLAADVPDVRVADGTDVAVLVDFDALRRDGGVISAMVSEALDDLVRGKVFSEGTGNEMRGFGHLFLKKIEDAGLEPKNFHWLLCGLRASEFYVRDTMSITQQIWSVAATVDGCNWNRIGGVVEANGLKWQKDTVFGHRVYSAIMKQGKVARYNVRCVPGGDKMAFFGYGASKEWECYNANASLDARFADMGHLDKGEIVRIVIVDDKPLSSIARHLYHRLYPVGASQIPERIRCFRLSLLCDGKTVSAELVFSCADAADADILSKAYLALKTPESLRGMVERFEQISSHHRNYLEDASFDMRNRIVKDMEVSCEGNTVVLSTREQDARTAFAILLGSIGKLADFFGSFAR